MYNLLVVEDEEMIKNKILQNIDWKENGFNNIYDANDGEEAFEIIKNNKIDLIITDIEMPNLGGIDLIRKVKSCDSNIKVIIITGHAEFEYAMESIKLDVENYILKPFISKNLLKAVNEVKEKIIRERNEKNQMEDLKKQVRNNKRALRKKLFNDLLSNNFIGNIQNNLDYLDLGKLKNREFFVIVINMNNFDEFIEENDEEQKYIYNLSVYSNVNEFIKGKGIEYKILNYKIDQIVGIFFEDIHNIMNLLDELVERVSKDIGVKLTIGAGNSYSNLKDMYMSYKEACSAAALSYIYGRKKVYTYSDINLGKRKYDKIIHIINENKIFTDLKVGAFEEIKKDIVNITKEVRSGDLDIDAINTVVNNIILITSKTINEMGYNIIDIFGPEFKFNFNVEDIGNLEQLEQKLFEFFNKINEYISLKRENTNKQLMFKIKSFVDDNFTSNISLTSISKMFNISSGYLSILFNDFAGENFIDYITNLRIHKAKEYLKNTDMRVYEIAESVGYRNAYYFSTAFKKSAGISPSEYRENINNV